MTAELICPGCGKRANTGKFCTVCGWPLEPLPMQAGTLPTSRLEEHYPILSEAVSEDLLSVRYLPSEGPILCADNAYSHDYIYSNPFARLARRFFASLQALQSKSENPLPSKHARFLEATALAALISAESYYRETSFGPHMDPNAPPLKLINAFVFMCISELYCLLAHDTDGVGGALDCSPAQHLRNMAECFYPQQGAIKKYASAWFDCFHEVSVPKYKVWLHQAHHLGLVLKNPHSDYMPSTDAINEFQFEYKIGDIRKNYTLPMVRSHTA